MQFRHNCTVSARKFAVMHPRSIPEKADSEQVIYLGKMAGMFTGPVGALVKSSGAEIARYSRPSTPQRTWDSVGSMDGIGNRPLLPPQGPNYTRPKLPSDVFNGPYKGPDELDNYGCETPYMRLLFRRLYLSVPELLSAIDGKVNSLASAPVSVQPEDKAKRSDREAAEFLKWTVEESEDGWDGLIRDIAIGAFVDGWSVVEPTFGGMRHPKLGAATGLDYARGMDTYYLRLELDSYRRVMGVVSLRRGLEVFDPEQCLIYTHRKWFADPFGNSDVRSVYQTCLMIEDAYRLWDKALQIFGVPMVNMKLMNPAHRKEAETAIAALRAGGYIITGKDDETQLLNLASATGFDAFQKNIESKRERVFLAIRGAYLPFLEGQGGERRGDTRIHKDASDANVELPARSIARMLRKGLAKKVTEFNFPGAGVPIIKIGGTDWQSTKAFVDMVAAAKEKCGANIGAKFFHEESGLPPPEDENDVLGVIAPVPPKPGDGGAPATQTPGPGEQPGGEFNPKPVQPEPPKAGTTLPTDRGTVSSVAPAPLTVVEQGSAVPPFSRAQIPNYGDFFLPDRHGRYPGDIHEQFGVGIPDFASGTGLKRRQVTGKAGSRWVWSPSPASNGMDGVVATSPNLLIGAPRPAPDEIQPIRPADSSGAPEVQSTTQETSGQNATDITANSSGANLDLLAAMMQAKIEGDDAAVDALADLASDPDGLAELVADAEQPAEGSASNFSAHVKRFSSALPPKASGLAVRAADTGRLLMLKRADGGREAGQWEFPGGHIEDGERPHEAAHREFREETGIDLPASHSRLGSWQSPNGVYVGHVVEVPSESALERSEDGDRGETLAWLPPSLLTHDRIRSELRADSGRILPLLSGEGFAAPATQVFGWYSDPTTRSPSRATNSDTGKHAYGAQARALLERQGRDDRGEAHPETPKQSLQRQKSEAEPKREEARAAYQKALAEPDRLREADIESLRSHLHTLTRDEVRKNLRQLEKSSQGKLKANIVDALLDHVRSQAGVGTAKPQQQSPETDDLLDFGNDFYDQLGSLPPKRSRDQDAEHARPQANEATHGGRMLERNKITGAAAKGFLDAPDKVSHGTPDTGSVLKTQPKEENNLTPDNNPSAASTPERWQDVKWRQNDGSFKSANIADSSTLGHLTDEEFVRLKNQFNGVPAPPPKELAYYPKYTKLKSAIAQGEKQRGLTAAKKTLGIQPEAKKPKTTPSYGKELWNDLTEDQQEALTNYTLNSDGINAKLRNGHGGGDDDLDAVFKKSKTPNDMTVYRGIDYDPEWSVGEEVADKAYMSTSKGKTTALGFATNHGKTNGGVVVKISLPQGSSAIDMNPASTSYAESEILLPRGTKFRIVDVDEDDEGDGPHKVYTVELVQKTRVNGANHAEEAKKVHQQADEYAKEAKTIANAMGGNPDAAMAHGEAANALRNVAKKHEEIQVEQDRRAADLNESKQKVDSANVAVSDAEARVNEAKAKEEAAKARVEALKAGGDPKAKIEELKKKLAESKGKKSFSAAKPIVNKPSPDMEE